MSDPVKILSLKKLPPYVHEVAESLHATIQEIEPFNIQYVADREQVINAISTAEGLLFTSIHGIQAIHKLIKPQMLEHKTIFCVGERATVYFKSKGIRVVKENDIASLGVRIIELKPKTLLYFHGDRSLQTIDKILENSPTMLKRLLVYRNSLLYPKINELDTYQILWYFSPSGVESFLKHNRFPDNAIIGVIGNTTRSCIPLNNVVTASKPDTITLLKESIHHFQNHGAN